LEKEKINAKAIINFDRFSVEVNIDTTRDKATRYFQHLFDKNERFCDEIDRDVKFIFWQETNYVGTGVYDEEGTLAARGWSRKSEPLSKREAVNAAVEWLREVLENLL